MKKRFSTFPEPPKLKDYYVFHFFKVKNIETNQTNPKLINVDNLGGLADWAGWLVDAWAIGRLGLF